LFEYAASFSILKLKTVDDVNVESGEGLSGMTTPLPNGIIQTTAETIGARKVNELSFNSAVRNNPPLNPTTVSNCLVIAKRSSSLHLVRPPFAVL